MLKALCIGINDYPGEAADLGGCINDANDWRAFFARHRYQARTLLDSQATKAAIVAGIKDVLGSLAKDELGVICYSGHGTWVPDLDGDEPDGRDEALVPWDALGDESKLLIDDEIKPLLEDRPKGSRVLFITDSCHSGTVFRFMNLGHGRPVRFLPPAQILKAKRRIAKAKVLAERIRPKTNLPLPGVIHFAACQDTEYAADAEFKGRPNGAFTYFLLQAFKKGGTFGDIFAAVRTKLPSREFTQRPALNATAGDKKRTF
jgi:hypothetical protein